MDIQTVAFSLSPHGFPWVPFPETTTSPCLLPVPGKYEVEYFIILAFSVFGWLHSTMCPWRGPLSFLGRILEQTWLSAAKRCSESVSRVVPVGFFHSQCHWRETGHQVYYSRVGCCDWSSLRHFLLPLKLAGCPALQLPAEMLDMLLWCIRFSYCWPHAEWYRSALRDLYLHGLPGDYLSLSQSPANFLTCRARILLGQWVSFGFQASCKIHQTFSCLHSFSAAIISYTVHFSQTLDVWNLVKAEDGVKCEWTASVSLGSLALFPRCCTVDLLCVGFTVFFFVLFLRERWHLLQYCDDYLNCKLYRVHNCSPFSVGNPYKIVFSDHFFLLFFFFFSPLTVENQIVQLQSLSSSLGIVCFYFLEPMIKRNLKTVNKYYCAEIWMSLQKCIWMS